MLTAAKYLYRVCRSVPIRQRSGLLENQTIFVGFSPPAGSGVDSIPMHHLLRMSRSQTDLPGFGGYACPGPAFRLKSLTQGTTWLWIQSVVRVAAPLRPVS